MELPTPPLPCFAQGLDRTPGAVVARPGRRGGDTRQRLDQVAEDRRSVRRSELADRILDQSGQVSVLPRTPVRTTRPSDRSRPLGSVGKKGFFICVYQLPSLCSRFVFILIRLIHDDPAN